MATFKDKVNAIKKSGKSEESAKKIVGSIVKNEKRAKVDRKIYHDKKKGWQFGTRPKQKQRDRSNEGYEPTKLKGKKRIPPSRVSPDWAVTRKSYPTSDYQRKVEYEQGKELGEDAISISESNAKRLAK